MRQELIISGFGGQGVMLAGTLLCYAGMKENKNVTFFPSYGAEIRGGTANSQIIISDDAIGSPVIYNPDVLVAFNKPSYDRFVKKVKKGGLILTNSSLYKPEPQDGIEIAEIPANNIAEECGSKLALNIVMLGALAKKKGTVKINSLTSAMPNAFAGKELSIIEMNKKAAEAGYSYFSS